MADSEYLIGETVISTKNVLSKAYSGLQFQGQCILDNICVRDYNVYSSDSNNKVPSQDSSKVPGTYHEMILKDPTDTSEWTPDVLFLAAMNGTTDASNVFNLQDSPTGWEIYRQQVNSSDVNIITKVADLPYGKTSFVDYKIEGMKSFNYLIYANSPTQVSKPLITDSIKTTFYGYCLYDAAAIDNNEDDVEYYKFNLNANMDKITDNNSVTVLKNYTQYDNIIVGKRDLLSGSITGILAYTDDTNEVGYSWSADYIDKFRRFINNGREKYLKMRNGKIIKCITASENSSMEVEFEKDVAGQQIPNVTFYFQESNSIN